MAGQGTPAPGSAPKMASKETQHPELTVRSSNLLHELTSLPLVGSLGSLYTRTRDSHWMMKTSLGMVEDAVSSVLDRLHIGSTVAIRMDKVAGEGVTRLKRRYPSITVPPEEIMQSSKDKATFLFHKTVRKICRTYPGQMSLKLFDWSVDKVDRLLRSVNPPVRSPRRRKMTRASVKKIQKEHAYASEDSGACEATGKHDKERKDLKAEDLNARSPPSMMNTMFQMGVVLPLEYSVTALKSVRRYLHAVSHKRRKPEKIDDLSPEKSAEIEARRKISPRKRKSMSLLDQVRMSAFSYLGYKEVRVVGQIQIETSGTDAANREEAERKRKHEEILTDQGSASEESNDDDLADFDIDNYQSEDDPDYEPSESGSSFDDISDAETESDLECEDVGGLVQLKEKKDGQVKDPQHHKKPLKPDEKAPDPPKEQKATNTDPGKKPDQAKDEKKTIKPDEKTSAEPSKDQKGTPGKKSDHSKKADEKSEPRKDEKDQKHDKKSQKPNDASKELPKDDKPKTPQGDKLPEPAVNGDHKPDDKQMKFGKFFNK